MESAELEDDDEPTSLSEVSQRDQMSSNQQADSNELEVFREEWREELRRKYQQPQQSTEEEAVSLYWMGAAAEKSGDMQAAVRYYKKACQLVPDIDFKLNREQSLEQVDQEEEEEDEFFVEGVAEGCGDLVQQFQTLNIQSPGWCQPDKSHKGTHISSLPLDMVRYIIRWVVSAQLDMRCLEMLSMVCRALYCIAREPLLWRAACRKVWSDATNASSYGDSWRRMFILRPHLRFNGVYICKSSYVREGERSLDSFYKPFHTVVYYRYLRFFPDGSVMYQTSPEDPALAVPKLCHKHFSDSVLLGEYTHTGNKVVIEVVSQASSSPQRQRGRGRGQKQESSYERRFHMELLLTSSSNRRRCNQLSWKEYYCHSRHKPSGHVQVSQFTLNYTYTPFYFSRVKSYSTNSTGMLT